MSLLWSATVFSGGLKFHEPPNGRLFTSLYCLGPNPASLSLQVEVFDKVCTYKGLVVVNTDLEHY